MANAKFLIQKLEDMAMLVSTGDPSKTACAAAYAASQQVALQLLDDPEVKNSASATQYVHLVRDEIAVGAGFAPENGRKHGDHVNVVRQHVLALEKILATARSMPQVTT